MGLEDKTDDQNSISLGETPKPAEKSRVVRWMELRQKIAARGNRVATLEEIQAEEKEMEEIRGPRQPDYSNRRFGEWGDLSSDEAFSPFSFGIKPR